MKTLLLVLAITAMALSTASATIVLSEDWETGTDGWVDYGAGPLAALDNTQNTTPGGEWSLKTPDNSTTNYTGAKDYDWATETKLVSTVTFNFMHQANTTRDYLQMQCYSGGGGSGSLLQLISFGIYNAAPADTTKYNFRVAVGSVGWANTTIARQAGVWHAMKVEQLSDGTLNFYVDGALGASTTTTSIHGVTKIRVGCGLTNNGYGTWFDDINVNVVPEPGSLVALGTGLIGLFGIIRRRR